MNLNEMRDEAYAVSKSKGWYEKGPRPIPVLLALVHSEISEALEAWRETGDEGISKEAERDTLSCLSEHGVHADCSRGTPSCRRNHKPEGVAAELADVVIRVGDMAGAYEKDLVADEDLGPYDLSNRELDGTDLPSQLAFLHADVTGCLLNCQDGDLSDLGYNLAMICHTVRMICEAHKIDLGAAVHAKMAFNKTRPHRHGGKHV